MVFPGLSAAPLLMMKRDAFNPSLPWGAAVEGGFYMGQVTDAGQLYALIVAPKAAGQAGSKISITPSGSPATGAASTTNGPANTAVLVALGSPAGLFCSGLTIGGKSDWYLPAQAELTAIYPNRAALPLADQYTADTPSDAYWTSTENASFPGYHEVRQFVTGGTNAFSAGSSQWVRAVRRVKI